MPLVFNGTNIEKVIYNGVELDKVVYNGVTVWENYSLPLNTSQKKTAGAGYSSGSLAWNGNYNKSKINEIVFNEANVGLHQGDAWMGITIELSDGQKISDEWGNGSINKTVSRTTNSGIPYDIRVEDKNVTYTFSEYIVATTINFNCYTKYGTWRAEGFNLNLYVTGVAKP